MTLFIQLKNSVPEGYPITEDNLKMLFPNASFPQYYTADAVEPLGFGIYDFSSAPDCGKHEKVVEVAPIREPEGIWRQTWAIVPMNDAEKTAADAAKADSVRMERYRLLRDSDWTQLADAPADKVAWAAYRQALRDVPSQPGFPWDINWPVAP